MSENQTLRPLADVAYESCNYGQAHDYYSRVLEANPGDAVAWQGKGLSAGWLAQPPREGLEEVAVCVRQAFKQGLGEEQKERTAHEITELAKSYLKKAGEHVEREFLEFQKRDFPPNVFLSIKLDEDKRKKNGLWFEVHERWMEAVRLMGFAADMNPSADRYATAMRYAEAITDRLGDVGGSVAFRNEMKRKVRELDPERADKMDEVSKGIAKSGSGCAVVIATLSTLGALLAVLVL